jgi:PRTRC genetic system ThiF family protein
MQVQLQPPKTFDPDFNPRNITLIGCGGTGAHLARLIARLLAHMQSQRLKIPQLRLIDPDRVELKNVGRQLFAPADVGRFKAEVIAQRLSSVFGLGIEWVNEPFDSQKHLDGDGYGAILIDAVDNYLARCEIAKATHGYSRLLISCGNHRDAGQVCIGNLAKQGDLKRYLTELEKYPHHHHLPLKALPNAYLLFPNLLEAETPMVMPTPHMTCADLILHNEQDLFINDTMALVAARYVQQILLRQPIQSFLTFVSVAGMTTVKPVPITVDNLKTYLKAETT